VPHSIRLQKTSLLRACVAALVMTAVTAGAQQTVPSQTGQDLVDALHAAFGNHHLRAVHTKGVIFEGSFVPAPEARTLSMAPIFAGGTLPVVARFSDFAGLPDLPDTEGPANPAGLALKIRAADGTAYDLASDAHDGFIVATADEFAAFLRAVGASGKPDTPHPTPVEQFLGAHPNSKAFLASLQHPESFASATYFGINSFKMTDGGGGAHYVRYRYVPSDGEKYLTAAELKSRGPNYLQDEIVQRAAKGPLVFDWYAQVAEEGDKIEDPSTAWPSTRKLVKLGVFTLAKRPMDVATAERQTLFLPGTAHPGIDPADPMLLLRNHAYPISFGERQ